MEDTKLYRPTTEKVEERVKREEGGKGLDLIFSNLSLDRQEHILLHGGHIVLTAKSLS